MPQLFVLTGGDVGRSFDVKSGDTLGRSPDCILTLKDASVSRRHAHLERVGASWYLVDDGSRNGILVGEKRVRRLELSDQSEFQLGEVLLRFRLEGPPPAVALEEEIVLEGAEEDAEATAPRPLERTRVEPRPPVAPRPAAGGPRPAAAGARGAGLAGAAARSAVGSGVAPRPGEPLQRRGGVGERVLQYHRVPERAGIAGAELSQMPGWMRAAFYLVALAVAAALFWFAFKGTWFVRGKLDRRAPAIEAHE